MVIFTTPTLRVEIEDEEFDFHTYDTIHVTFRQGPVEIDITNPEIISNTELLVRLTQEQTSRLSPGQVGVMLNLTVNGERIPSDIEMMQVGDNLLRRVI